MQVYLIMAMVFAILVAVFAVQNAALVDIRFLGWMFPGISLVLVILGSVAVGVVFTLLLGAPRQFSIYRRVRELQAQNKRMQDEVKQVKSIAVTDRVEPMGQSDSNSNDHDAGRREVGNP